MIQAFCVLQIYLSLLFPPAIPCLITFRDNEEEHKPKRKKSKRVSDMSTGMYVLPISWLKFETLSYLIFADVFNSTFNLHVMVKCYSCDSGMMLLK